MKTHASNLLTRTIALGFAMMASATPAATLINEGWAGYTDNTTLNGVAVQGGTGLSGNWAVANASAGVLPQNGAGETMSYTYGATTVSGNLANAGNTFQDPILSASIGSPITGTVYFRYLFTVVGLPTATAGTDAGIWLNFGADKAGWYIPTGGNPGMIFAGTTVGGGSTASVSLVNNNNVTVGAGNAVYTDNLPSHALLGELTYSGGVYTSVSLWLDPTTDQQTDLSSLVKLENISLTAGLTSLSTLSLGWEDVRIGSGTSAQRIGRVTFGDQWSDIGIVAVPEPSTFVLALGGAGMLLLFRRRSH